MCCGAPYLVFQLWMVLYDFNKNLYVLVDLHELEFVPSGVSLHRFYVEDGPQVRSNSEACFRVLESKCSVHAVSLDYTGYTHKLLYEFHWW